MKKANNKGFTLVELIIVVAIIAVLAAVLAPQYLRYVERARQSNDLQVATSIMRATTAAISDPQVGVASSSTVYIRWQTTASSGQALSASFASYGGTSATNLLNEIAATMGWAAENASNQMVYSAALVDDAQSSAGNLQNFAFTVDAATGQIEIASGSDDWVTEIGVSQPVATTP